MDRGSHHCPLQTEKGEVGSDAPCAEHQPPRHQPSPCVLPFLPTEAFECHSRHSARAAGPRGEAGGVQACPVPCLYLQGPTSAGSLLRCPCSLGYEIAYTCVIFFSSLKTRLNSPAHAASGLVEPLRSPPPTFKLILDPTPPQEL